MCNRVSVISLALSVVLASCMFLASSIVSSTMSALVWLVCSCSTITSMLSVGVIRVGMSVAIAIGSSFAIDVAASIIIVVVRVISIDVSAVGVGISVDIIGVDGVSRGACITIYNVDVIGSNSITIVGIVSAGAIILSVRLITSIGINPRGQLLNPPYPLCGRGFFWGGEGLLTRPPKPSPPSGDPPLRPRLGSSNTSPTKNYNPPVCPEALAPPNTHQTHHGLAPPGDRVLAPPAIPLPTVGLQQHFPH